MVKGHQSFQTFAKDVVIKHGKGKTALVVQIDSDNEDSRLKFKGFHGQNMFTFKKIIWFIFRKDILNSVCYINLIRDCRQK